MEPRATNMQSLVLYQLSYIPKFYLVYSAKLHKSSKIFS